MLAEASKPCKNIGKPAYGIGVFEVFQECWAILPSSGWYNPADLDCGYERKGQVGKALFEYTLIPVGMA